MVFSKTLHSSMWPKHDNEWHLFVRQTRHAIMAMVFFISKPNIRASERLFLHPSQMNTLYLTTTAFCLRAYDLIEEPNQSRPDRSPDTIHLQIAPIHHGWLSKQDSLKFYVYAKCAQQSIREFAKQDNNWRMLILTPWLKVGLHSG